MALSWEALVNGKWIPITGEDLLFRPPNFTAYREVRPNRTICRNCHQPIKDGQLVLDWSLDGNQGEHAKGECPAYALQDDYQARLTMKANA